MIYQNKEGITLASKKQTENKKSELVKRFMMAVTLLNSTLPNETLVRMMKNVRIDNNKIKINGEPIIPVSNSGKSFEKTNDEEDLTK
jgi:hypothetical protein